MNVTRRKPLQAIKDVAVVATSALMLICGSAMAQGYPERLVKVVVPWAPGGTVDAVARIVAQRLTEKMAQAVIVESKGGANGIIGTDYVAKAAPDGYTLVISNAETHTINPHVYPKLPYDPMADFVAITPLVKVPFVLAAKSGLPAASLKEAVALVKSQPRKFTYGSWGIGSVPHIGMEMLVQQTAMDMLHVPYTGGPPAFNALIAGQIDFMIIPAGIAAPLKKDGKIKVLGITDVSRFQLMEDVPTIKEQGYNMELLSILGLMAPAKTPQTVIRRLSSDVSGILQSPDIQAKLQAIGTETVFLSPDEYARYLRAELPRWGQIIRKANITIQ